MYKIAICDDEIHLREELDQMCQNVMQDIGYDYQTACFSNTADLYEELIKDEKAYDLLLLDICMEKESGMDLAKKLRDQGNRIHIIFVTGSDEYLLEGYSVQPIHYLLKPVTISDLHNALDVALRLNPSPQTVILESGRRRLKLELDHVLYLESMNHELRIHMEHETVSLILPLTKAQKALPADLFCRCHKSFLINLTWVRDIARREIILKNDEHIPIGRSYMSAVSSEFVRYLNRF